MIEAVMQKIIRKTKIFKEIKTVLKRSKHWIQDK